MKITRKEYKGTVEGPITIGELRPGEACIMYEAYYIKLDKKQIGQGLHVNHTRDHCVLFNIKQGSMREVKHTVECIPCLVNADFITMTRKEAVQEEVLRLPHEMRKFCCR